MITLSVLILTHNRPHELSRCLSSLKKEKMNLTEIIILDNGSEPPIERAIWTDFPKIKWIRSEKNIGVAAGRNVLASHAIGSLLWFLDDDATLGTQEASTLIQRYFEKSSVAVVSFKVLNEFTHKEEVRCIPDRRKRPTHADLQAAYFVGCSFVIQKKAFSQVGGFWAPLHYSCEELDLSYRLIDLKYECMRSNSLEVYHSYRPSRERTSSWIYFNARNRTWTALRNLPLRYVISQTVFWWTYTGWISVRQRQWKVFMLAVIDCVRGVKDAYSSRRLISQATCRRVAELGGRIWY